MRTYIDGYRLLISGIACLGLLLAACGGSGGGSTQNNNGGINQGPTQCVSNTDCSSGYHCSSSGTCVVDGTGADPTPSACIPDAPGGPVLYVATDGSDQDNDGTASSPYASITHSLDQAVDGTVILVQPGEYYGRVRVRGTFPEGVIVRSEVPYMARLRNNGRVITAYAHPDGCSGITIEGFDIAHDGPGAGALVVHLDADGTGAVSNITVRNNILHDSYNNDILKINHGISDVLVERNLFYNQQGSDEHIDINSAANIIVQDNIFMNDFAGSGRTNGNDTSSYIVVKDSNGSSDRYLGSSNISIRRNIFLNWEGSTGSNFVLLGEDGNDFYEAENVTIENNLMLGNSAHVMRASFGVKGCRNIVFNNNTITGDLPALAYAMRFNREGSNPVNTDIEMYNNIWSDPTGNMGARNAGDANDFSDTPSGHILDYTLNNNLYWNGLNAIPDDANETINVSDDVDAHIADPEFADPSSLTPPRWRPADETFADGSETTCQVFENLIQNYGTPGSPVVVDQADADHAPADDIMGQPRGAHPDIGALEVQ